MVQDPAAAGMAAEDAVVAAVEGLAAAEGAGTDGTSRNIPRDHSAGNGTTSHSEIVFSYLLPYIIGDCWGDTNPPLRFGP